MREVILGIKDYLNDCWHDYVLSPMWKHDERRSEGGITGKFVTWKEGSIWHYIRQRRIAKKAKEIAQQSER